MPFEVLHVSSLAIGTSAVSSNAAVAFWAPEDASLGHSKGEREINRLPFPSSKNLAGDDVLFHRQMGQSDAGDVKCRAGLRIHSQSYSMPDARSGKLAQGRGLDFLVGSDKRSSCPLRGLSVSESGRGSETNQAGDVARST